MFSGSALAPGKGLGLRSKFVLSVAGLIFIISLLIVIIQQVAVRRAILEQTGSQGASIADTIESTAGYYVIFGLTDDLKGIMDDLKKNTSVEYADFLSSEGNVLAATDPRKIPEAFKKSTLTRSRTNTEAEEGERRLYLSVRPFFESRADASNPDTHPRGFFRLALNDRRARQAVREFAVGNIVVILLAAGIGIGLANLGARLIVGPILRLADWPVRSHAAISPNAPRSPRRTSWGIWPRDSTPWP